jgi:hypothetical protein
MSSEDPDQNLLLRGRFSFGLKQAILAAAIGVTIAAIVAISNLP